MATARKIQSPGELSGFDRACSYGEQEGESHPCTLRFLSCPNCGADTGCSRCRGQAIWLYCKLCEKSTSLFEFYRNRLKPQPRPHDPIGTVRFTASGFPMITEGDHISRPVRIDLVPLRRKISTDSSGAYLDSNGTPLHPAEWAQA